MADVSLEVGEIEIKGDSAELLYRQITPHIWVSDDGVPANHAFGPLPIDKGKPSYSRESKTEPQTSFEWHNDNANSPSHGVWACSVEEVNQASLAAIDDSGVTVNPPQAPGHCYVDFRGLSRGERKDRRSILLRAALARGLVYPDAPVIP